jgi:CheY-like chemotaxis protein
VQAVDQLAAQAQPGQPRYAGQARLANLLRLHYLEGLTVQDTALELDLSQRQAFRDLRRAEENLAALLWPRLSARAGGPQQGQPESTLQTEAGRVEANPQPVDVIALVRNSLEAVARLAEQRGVRIEASLPEGACVVRVDPVLARQVLVSGLSQVIQGAGGAAIALALESSESEPRLTLRYRGRAAKPGAPPAGTNAEQLARRLSWTLAEAEDEEGPYLAVGMGASRTSLLVIDDNQGLRDLLERYLSGLPCRLIGVGSATEGLRLAQELGPAAIVLDIMMPQMDGWEVLQRLRTYPQTAAIPVIICSALNDPELAYSLGAAVCLSKPVKQEDFLAAVRKVGVV